MIFVSLVVLVALAFSGCATTVPLQVQKAPTLDTREVRSIAVAPFTAGNYNWQNIASYATNQARTQIQNTGQFTMVDITRVESRWRSGQSFDNDADAIFTGTITAVRESVVPAKVLEFYDVYKTRMVDGFMRTVEVEITYQLIKGRDGSILGPISKTGKDTDSKVQANQLNSTENMAQGIITKQLGSLNRDLVVHTVTINPRLAKDNNKDTQKQMDAAYAQAKSGNYKAALDNYIMIYNNTKSMAAAENASIFFRATGDTPGGADFMRRVINDTGNPRATQLLNEINQELAESGRAAEYAEARSDTRRPTEKISQTAIDETQNQIQRTDRIWIHNNSPSESMLNDVIDNMTSMYISTGMTVVDRQSINLIMQEQKLQMSGFVSDDDLVSVGNMAGVNRIIILSITGSGQNRRLSVKVLDVERGTILMQSDTSDKWSI
jgi:hypothetical protein